MFYFFISAKNANNPTWNSEGIALKQRPQNPKANSSFFSVVHMILTHLS